LPREQAAMIAIYGIENSKLKLLGDDLAGARDSVWIDLLKPVNQEDRAVSAALGIDVPTREEMQEIELSSRLYLENGAAVMTALVLSHTDADDVILTPMTFILSGTHLLTVRYEDPRSFEAFARRAQKGAVGCSTADSILVSLLEAVVERLADILERAGQDIDRLSRSVFRPAPEPVLESSQGFWSKLVSPAPRPRDFQKMLVDIGRKGDLTSNIRDSLVTLQRLFTFLFNVAHDRKPGKDIQARIKTLTRDAQSLSDQASFLSQKITFLLDATLGMLNIEQNNIIKIFSVAAVVFLPPTLLASIEGMNFHFMPELNQPWGYPLWLILLVLSAILPLLYFKHRGWL
jgi:magnesium transporter